MDNSDLFALLVSTAIADGRISPEEKRALIESPGRWNISRDEFERGRDKAKNASFDFQPPRTSSEAEDVLAKLASIVVVDGKVDAAEIALLLELSVGWNVDGGRVADILLDEWSKRSKP